MKNKTITKNLIESSLSKIWKLTKKHDSGTISTYRGSDDFGENDGFTHEETRVRDRVLNARLLDKGYSVVKGKGVSLKNYGTNKAREVKENLFIVIDMRDSGNLKNDLLQLGQEFEQNSIAFSQPNGKYELVSLSKNQAIFPDFGTLNISIELNKLFFAKYGEFNSTIPVRPYIFEAEITEELILQSKGNMNISAIRSVVAIANMDYPK